MRADSDGCLEPGCRTPRTHIETGCSSCSEERPVGLCEACEGVFVRTRRLDGTAPVFSLDMGDEGGLILNTGRRLILVDLEIAEKEA